MNPIRLSLGRITELTLPKGDGRRPPGAGKLPERFALIRQRGLGVAVALAVIVAIPAMVVAALSVTYVQVDANGPPKAAAKGAGDLDRDGKADLVVGSTGGGLYWYKNDSWAKRTISSDIKTAEEIEVADLDGVKGKDVILAVPGGAVWFANNGSGTSWTKRTLTTGQTLHDIKAADFDGDGKLDVAGRGSYPRGNKVSFWRQVSPTSFVESTLNLPEAGSGLVAVDLDRDGKIDVAVGKYWFKNTSTTGRIGFSSAFTYSTAAEQDARIAAGKINSDGYVDLFITPPHPTIGGRHDVAWYQAPANPTGQWTRKLLEANAQPVVHSAEIVDLDGDGDNDLATAMDSLGTNPNIKAYINNGNGSFGAPQIIANKASHAMRVVVVGGKKGLFGADYNERPRSSIDLWKVGP